MHIKHIQVPEKVSHWLQAERESESVCVSASPHSVLWCFALCIQFICYEFGVGTSSAQNYLRRACRYCVHFFPIRRSTRCKLRLSLAINRIQWHTCCFIFNALHQTAVSWNEQKHPLLADSSWNSQRFLLFIFEVVHFAHQLQANSLRCTNNLYPDESWIDRFWIIERRIDGQQMLMCIHIRMEFDSVV